MISRSRRAVTVIPSCSARAVSRRLAWLIRRALAAGRRRPGRGGSAGAGRGGSARAARDHGILPFRGRKPCCQQGFLPHWGKVPRSRRTAGPGGARGAAVSHLRCGRGRSRPRTGPDPRKWEAIPHDRIFPHVVPAQPGRGGALASLPAHASRQDRPAPPAEAQPGQAHEPTWPGMPEIRCLRPTIMAGPGRTRHGPASTIRT